MEKESEQFSKDLLESMGRLKCDEKFSGFIIKVGGEDIPVHRFLISSASPYFEAMLSNDTIETQRSWAEILDLDPVAVKTCIDFIYAGKAKLSLENPELLIQASDLMQIPQLKEMYFEFLVDNVTIETCLYYAHLASKYHINEFVDRLKEYVTKNVEKIFDLKCILKRSLEDIRHGLDLLPESFLDREMRKWKVIEAWVKADAENRSKEFPDLFKILLLDEIAIEDLTQDILVSKLVRNSGECTDAITASLSTAKKRPHGQVVVASITKPPPPYTQKPTHIIAMNRDSLLLHSMDLATLQWSRFVRLPEYLASSDIISIRGEVYLRSKDGYLIRYSDKKWEKLCMLERQLQGCQWLALDDYLWFIKGKSIRKYNPFTNTWTLFPATLNAGGMYTCAISKHSMIAVREYRYPGPHHVNEFDFTSQK